MTGKHYAKRIKDAWDVHGRGYNPLFPIIGRLRTPAGVRNFMNGYVEVMREIVQARVDNREEENYLAWLVMKGTVTTDTAARILAEDNLSMLAKVYYMNTDKRVPGFWNRVISGVCKTD